MRSEQDRHNLAHAKYLCEKATPEAPEVCFDYTLVQSILALIKSDAKEIAALRETLSGIEAKAQDALDGSGRHVEALRDIVSSCDKALVDEQTAGETR